MAQVIQSSDLGKDDENKPGAQGGTLSAPAAGQGTPAPSAGAAPSAQNYNPNAQRGSGYTNIQKVVNANKGNQLGNTIGSNLQNVNSAAQENLKNSQNQFQQQSQDSQFNTDANKAIVQNVINDPTKYAETGLNTPDSQSGAKFQNLISGQYQGPEGLANADQLQNQASNAAQIGQALKTAPGRIGVLNQVVGKPQYTQGQQNLDSLLLAQGNSPQLQEAKRNALLLQGKVNTGLAGAQAQAKESANLASGFGQDVQNKLKENLSAQDIDLQAKAKAANEAKDAQYNQMLEDLKSGNITQEEADMFGLKSGDNVYNLFNDPSKFVQKSALTANEQNIASPEQYARMEALKKLSGNYGPQDIFSKYADSSQGGKFAADKAITADNERFVKGLQATDQDYKQSLEQPAQAVQNAQQIVDLRSGNLDPQLVQKAAQAGVLWNGIPVDQALQRGASLLDVGGQIADYFHPGSGSGGYQQRLAWANNNLATQKDRLASTQANLDAAYGNPLKVNIKQPQSAYPSLIPGGDNLENFPKVK